MNSPAMRRAAAAALLAVLAGACGERGRQDIGMQEDSVSHPATDDSTAIRIAEPGVRDTTPAQMLMDADSGTVSRTADSSRTRPIRIPAEPGTRRP